MIDPAEALDLVIENAAAREPRVVALEESVGFRLAEEVGADRPQPPFDRAMMDGYAVRLADAGQTVTVAGEIAAGAAPVGAPARGSCLEIMTGAPCPAGTEAVVPKEAASRSGSRVVLPSRIALGQHIAPAGSECGAGQPVLKPGDLMTPLAVAVLASFGKVRVRVTPRPTLGIIATGAELAPPESEPPPGQIRDSNGPMLRAMAFELGIERPLVLRADDRLKAIVDALERVAECDVVLLSGGVSVGNHDLVPDAVLAYGARVIFHKARQKPGKPLLFAARERQLLFGLPGNPLACHFCFCRYVQAAVRRMGAHPAGIVTRQGRLVASLCPDRGRSRFVPAMVSLDPSVPEGWSIRPLPGASSADVFRSHQANAYVAAPPGTGEIPAGHVLPFSPIAHV